MSTIPYLASLAHGQTSVLNRHVLEYNAQYNAADEAMIMDDIQGAIRTLRKLEQEVMKELGEKDHERNHC
jgi:hypothetical protein